MSAMLPTWAGKGGKGDGGNNSSVPPLQEPFVQYRVTWPLLDEGVGTNLVLRDVNRDGFAVGRFETPDGNYRAVLADKDGKIEDLNVLFDGALAAHPGWRFHATYCINAAGQVAGTLVPNEQPRSSNSPDVQIICASLYTNPPSITVVDRVLGTGVWEIKDMNEAGDMVVTYGNGTEHGLYRAPYSDAPEQIVGPEGAEDFKVGYINGAGQVTMAALFNEPVYRNRKQYEERLVQHVVVREPDGSLLDYGYGPGSQWPVPISEDGVLYNASNGADPTTVNEGIIHQWSEIQGWQPITQEKGSLHAGVSKEVGNNGELVIDVDSFGDERVYREGYGTYTLEVTSGLKGRADVESYYASPRLLLGVSRPNEATGAGYICGDNNDCSFILTPLAIP